MERASWNLFPRAALMAVCVALYGCGSGGPHVSKAEVEQALAELKAADWRTRHSACETLKKMAPQDRTAVEALANCLEDAESRVREAAAEALTAIGAEALPALARMQEHEDYAVRAAAAKAMGGAGAEAAITLASCLNDRHPFVRQRAAEALKALGPDAAPAREALMTALQDEEEAFVRVAVVDALGAQGPAAAEAAPGLIKALNDEDPWMRFHAVWALGDIGPRSDARAELEAMLADEDYEVRAAAADVLGRFGEAARPALERVAGDPASDIRPMAFESLGEIGSVAIPFLERYTEDDDAEIRAAAAQAREAIAQSMARAQRHALMLGVGLLIVAIGMGMIVATRRTKKKS